MGTTTTSNTRTDERYTIAHVTHEAVEKVGGIGTVLEGMMSSPSYQKAVRRSILVGPMGGHHFASPMRRFGTNGVIRYCSRDGIDTENVGASLSKIEEKYGVGIAYGLREFIDEGTGRSGEAEVLLFDVSNPKQEPLNQFKWRLWSEFGIDAGRFESDWGFEEYCRLAEPAFEALSMLVKSDASPCIVFSHEFMGMCTALKTVLDGESRFRTVFHAHECATARHLVEHHPGHDTAFYNVLRHALERGEYVEDLFGDLSGNMRHSLISRAHRLDAIAAVGDPTADEMRFLNRDTNESGRVEIVYNGIPALPTDRQSKERSRNMMLTWCENAVGFRPEFIFTHVTRPVISKGLWRDMKVCNAIDSMLAARDERAIFVVLTCGAPPRGPQQVRDMAESYGWPRTHREGYPDLVGPECGIWHMMDAFNKEHAHVQTVLVNQFGWSRDQVGPAVPEKMNFVDLRRAADVEFGQSVYEPFGIAQFEPFAGGAICIPGSVCGCVASWRHVLDRLHATPAECPNVIVADYTQLDDDDLAHDEQRILAMTERERTHIEERVADDIARQLIDRLPRSSDERERLIESAARFAPLMSWDSVIEDELLPLLEKIVAMSSSPTPSHALH